MLLFDHFSYQSPSLQQHAFGMYRKEFTGVSKQAEDKRVDDKALLFIEKLFAKPPTAKYTGKQPSVSSF